MLPFLQPRCQHLCPKSWYVDGMRLSRILFVFQAPQNRRDRSQELSISSSSMRYPAFISVSLLPSCPSPSVVPAEPARLCIDWLCTAECSNKFGADILSHQNLSRMYDPALPCSSPCSAFSDFSYVRLACSKIKVCQAQRS